MTDPYTSHLFGAFIDAAIRWSTAQAATATA
jgi:hypothetical protein